MQIYVGVTDPDWFFQLEAMNADEVNFWKPGASNFMALPPGGLFLFKLRYPENAIVGGGFFVRYSALPLSVAWEAFGEKNGVRSRSEFRSRIIKLRHSGDKREQDPSIGCIVLANPFFLNRERWISVPTDFSSNTVQGKKYSTDSVTGAMLWTEVTARVSGWPLLVREERQANSYAERTVMQRLGQGAFRVVVTEAYERRCAMTGERTLPVLEAAHIKPYSSEGPHRPENGLLLRSDLHKLFDDGYLTVTPNLKVEVSGEIRERFQNGRQYYALHGQNLAVIPGREVSRPSAEFLDWHNRNVFMG